MNNLEFNHAVKSKPSPFDNRWVRITRKSEYFSGKLADLTLGNYILNPYQTTLFKGSSRTTGLKEDKFGLQISIGPEDAIAETSEAEILAHCDYLNASQELEKNLNSSLGIIVVGPVEARKFLIEHKYLSRF